MIGRWVTHAIVYLSVCSTLSLVWVVLGSGTADDLKDYAATPGNALTVSFWPVWFWLLWGTVVVVHGAVVLGRLLRPKRWKAARAALVGAGPEHPTRRFVAAMFTDLSGSTEAAAALGDATWVELLETHRGVVRDATREFDGIEVATQGDGFFVRFDHPGRAADCAAAIQQRSARARSTSSDLPPVRVGIHVGDAIHATDDDVLGTVVNVAARLLDVAGPDDIIVTEPVADHLDSARLDDRGLVELKGIEGARHVLALRWDDAPSPPEPRD